MIAGISEAKRKLPKLVERAAKGEVSVTARRGKPQARLVSMAAVRGRTLKKIFDAMMNRPRIILPRGITIKDLIEEIEESRRF